jgi:signal transduction histidine kinase
MKTIPYDQLKDCAKDEASYQTLVHLYEQVQAEAQSKLQNRSTILSTLAHELRTPLAIISSGAELLEKYLDEMTLSKRRARFARIYAYVRRMTYILDEMAYIAKMDDSTLSFMPSAVDFVQFCQERVLDVSQTIGIGHIIQFNAPGHPLYIRADERLLGYIIMNLLSNAIKYSDRGTLIEVSLSANKDMAILSVQDQGIGMGEETQANIFKPFYRGSNASDVTGLGLGMSIVRDAVDAHRGEVHIKSNYGSGTLVTVWLPLSQNSSHTF